MKVNFSPVSFGNRDIRYYDTNHNILETFDDRQNLIRRIKYDKLCRDVDSVEFNEKKEVIGHLHKEYTPDGCIETYKSKTQEYVREIKTFVKDSFTHHIEKFASKTSPQNNYINEFVRDATGKLVKVINNGKVLIIK